MATGRLVSQSPITVNTYGPPNYMYGPAPQAKITATTTNNGPAVVIPASTLPNPPTVKVHTTGPVFHFIEVPGPANGQGNTDPQTSAAYFLGTSEFTPRVRFNTYYSAIRFNQNYGSRLPGDQAFEGKSAQIYTELNVYSEKVLQMLEASPREGFSRRAFSGGRYAATDVGSMLIGDRGYFGLHIIFSTAAQDVPPAVVWTPSGGISSTSTLTGRTNGGSDENKLRQRPTGPIPQAPPIGDVPRTDLSNTTNFSDGTGAGFPNGQGPAYGTFPEDQLDALFAKPPFPPTPPQYATGGDDIFFNLGSTPVGYRFLYCKILTQYTTGGSGQELKRMLIFDAMAARRQQLMGSSGNSQHYFELYDHQVLTASQLMSQVLWNDDNDVTNGVAATTQSGNFFL